MWSRCKKPLLYLGNCSKSPGFLQSYALSDTAFKKSKIAPLQERKMIDRCRLWVKGGDGGNGCSSFRRSRSDRRGKADGANGGRGGDVILESSRELWDFSSVLHHVNAKRGGHGESKNKIGSRGHDKVILVPVGTVIHLVEGDIPSVVEKVKVCSEALDPWEIPSTLEFHESESDQQTTSPDRNTMKIEKNAINNASSLELSMGKSTNVMEANQVSLNDLLSKSSPLNIKPKVHLKDLDFCEEDESSEWEALQTDDDMSEAELMEETEEKQPIKYNVAELTEPGQRIIVAHGGDGGLGNITTGRSQRISKLKKHGEEKNNDLETEVSDDEQNPSVSIGLPGTEAVLLLELKSIADVGLVGMPNAGKSTLLGALSRARPIVGHYEFTTLRPNLGNLNYDDFSITVADIPGLIKGAHENRGLGHAFLRHIERTKVLAYVVDLAAGLEGRKGIPPWEQLRDLLLELEFYQKGLTDRPSLVVANKTDEEGTEEVYQELKRRVPTVPIFPVCAVLQEGVAELKDGLRMLVGGVKSYKLNIDDIDAD